MPGVAYYISAHVKLVNAASGDVGITIREAGDARNVFFGELLPANMDSWTLLQEKFTLPMTGYLNDLVLIIEGPEVGVDFLVDSIKMTRYESTETTSGMPTKSEIIIMYKYEIETVLEVDLDEIERSLKFDILKYLVEDVCRQDNRYLSKTSHQGIAINGDENGLRQKLIDDNRDVLRRKLGVLELVATSTDSVSGVCYPAINTNNICTAYESKIVVKFEDLNQSTDAEKIRSNVLQSVAGYARNEEYREISGIAGMQLLFADEENDETTDEQNARTDFWNNVREDRNYVVTDPSNDSSDDSRSDMKSVPREFDTHIFHSYSVVVFIVVAIFALLCFLCRLVLCKSKTTKR